MVSVRPRRRLRKQRVPVSSAKTKTSTTAVGKAIRALGTMGGGALGAYLGNPALGGAAGNQLGGLASRWLGFGDYTISTNSIVSKASNGIPSMHSNDQNVIVRHKEYIGSLVSSVDFKVQYELPLNPGMSSTFPWLASIASRFQEYQLLGAVFHYIPSSGTAVTGTNPALGNVMMQTSYRASDTAPTDKIEMMNEYCASEAVPSTSFIHPIECDPRENPFSVHYVRNTSPPAGEPLMSYDLGKTFIATKGQLADGSILGDIWVTYEVELKKPLIRSAVVTQGTVLASVGSGTTVSTMYNGTVSIVPGAAFIPAFSASQIQIPAKSGKTFTVTTSFNVSNVSAMAYNAEPVLTNATPAPNHSNGAVAGTGILYGRVLSGSATTYFRHSFTVSDPTIPAVVDYSGCFTATGTLGSACYVAINVTA